YLSPTKNPFRKWHEAILALRAESCLDKDRILEIYLNVIEWGQSVYGCEAASRAYFGHSAASLSTSEAALLASMIPNPILRNPHAHNPQLYRDQQSTLREMRHFHPYR